MAASVQQPGGELVARAVRVFRWVSAIELGFFVMFGAGGFLLVYNFGKQAGPSCVLNASSTTPTCTTSHPLTFPIVLAVAGFLGMIVTMIVAAQWTIRTLGVGALAYLRNRRLTGAAMTGSSMQPGGMPPGMPGSPSGPPVP